MKNFKLFLTPAFLLFLMIIPAPGQTLFVENFDYAIGDTLLDQGWTQIRAGNPITVVQQGLSFPGYLDNIGNAARLASDGKQEIRHTFPAVSADSLYVSYLINVSNDTSAWGIYLYLGPAETNVFQRYLSAYISKNESDKLAFGIYKGGGIKSTAYDYDLNTTYLILLKYKFNPGENDDMVSLWVNPVLNGLETPPDASSSNGNDADSLGGIVLSQLTASNWPPDAIIDGIRITKSWQDLPLTLGSLKSIPVASFALAQNYPNPFNPTTTINYELNQGGYVDLGIYNSIGQKVATLVAEPQSAGKFSLVWNATGFASGIYICRLYTGNMLLTRRMLLVK